LYALGVIGYEMLTLKMPFDGESVMDILRSHLRSPVPDVRKLRADVPLRLAGLITELLRKDPTERPQSADAVVWHLRHVSGAAEAHRRSLSALIVDDDSDARVALSMMVKRVLPAAEIHVANTARAAIHLVHRKHPTLILLDLDLPGINGVELCMYLRG